MKSICYLLRAGFFLGLIFDPEDAGDVPPKHRVTEMHGVMYHKIELCWIQGA
jgi:hypothetical protein